MEYILGYIFSNYVGVWNTMYFNAMSISNLVQMLLQENDVSLALKYTVDVLIDVKSFGEQRILRNCHVWVV